MANDLNLCQFIGRLGRDPEISYLASGDAVCNFSLAVGWKGKDKEGVEWVNVVAFKKLAEIISQYTAKGQQIYISGKMRTRKWESRDGETKYSTEIVADQMQLLGSKNDSQGQGSTNTPPRRESGARSEYGSGTGDYQFNDDEQIPF